MNKLDLDEIMALLNEIRDPLKRLEATYDRLNDDDQTLMGKIILRFLNDTPVEHEDDIAGVLRTLGLQPQMAAAH